MTMHDGLPYMVETACWGAFCDPLEGVGILTLAPDQPDMEDPQGAFYGSLEDADFADIMRKLEADGWELASADGEYWEDGTPVEPLRLGERSFGLILA